MSSSERVEGERRVTVLIEKLNPLPARKPSVLVLVDEPKNLPPVQPELLDGTGKPCEVKTPSYHPSKILREDHVTGKRVKPSEGLEIKSDDKKPEKACRHLPLDDYTCGEDVPDPDYPFTNLTPFLDRTFKLEVPSVAEAYPGMHLFYKGRANAIQGDTGLGKTILMMVAAIRVLNEGGLVLYIDPEDRPDGFVTRMLALGADPKAMRERVKYLHDPTTEQIRLAQKWAKVNHPDMVTLDGLAEAMAATGADENSAQDFLNFYRENLHPFASAGAALVIADHVPKNSKNRGTHARGTSAKAGKYDGVSYEIVPGKPFSPKQSGYIKLKIAKDRNGGTGAKGEIITELHLSPGSEGRTIAIFKSPKINEPPKQPLPTAASPDLTTYKDKITRFLQEKPSATKTEILKLEGKGEKLSKALSELVSKGIVGVKKEGRKHTHLLVTVQKTEASSPLPIVSQDIEGKDQGFPRIPLDVRDKKREFTLLNPLCPHQIPSSTLCPIPEGVGQRVEVI